jgi:hypothetical protein
MSNLLAEVAGAGSTISRPRLAKVNGAANL